LPHFRKELLCPLRNHEAESTTIADDLVIYCRSDCGWFNKLDNECSIVTLAQNMKWLHASLEELQEKKFR
jgi:hypothetical protein